MKTCRQAVVVFACLCMVWSIRISAGLDIKKILDIITGKQQVLKEKNQKIFISPKDNNDDLENRRQLFKIGGSLKHSPRLRNLNKFKLSDDDIQSFKGTDISLLKEVIVTDYNEKHRVYSNDKDLVVEDLTGPLPDCD